MQLSVPRSSFYAWRVRAGKLTATQSRREALGVEIERVFHDQRGTAGCRRIASILNNEGHPASASVVTRKGRGGEAARPSARMI